MLSSNGRVVMISGANRGLGRAIAGTLHQAGYTLSLGARSTSALAEAAAGWDAARLAGGDRRSLQSGAGSPLAERAALWRYTQCRKRRT